MSRPVLAFEQIDEFKRPDLPYKFTYWQNAWCSEAAVRQADFRRDEDAAAFILAACCDSQKAKLQLALTGGFFGDDPLGAYLHFNKEQANKGLALCLTKYNAYLVNRPHARDVLTRLVARGQKMGTWNESTMAAWADFSTIPAPTQLKIV